MWAVLETAPVDTSGFYTLIVTKHLRHLIIICPSWCPAHLTTVQVRSWNWYQCSAVHGQIWPSPSCQDSVVSFCTEHYKTVQNKMRSFRQKGARWKTTVLMANQLLSASITFQQLICGGNRQWITILHDRMVETSQQGKEPISVHLESVEWSYIEVVKLCTYMPDQVL